ncbi:MAG: flagellar hook-associated protein FlgK [Rhizobiaceae bacterium]
MSLSSALNIAQSSLRNTAFQTGVVSRNVQEAGNPDYSRRAAVLASTAPGASVVDVKRAVSEQLFKQNLSAISAASGQGAFFQGLDRLGLGVNGVDNASSPAAAIGRLQEALDLYAATPSNRNLAENALDAARQVVRSLNEGTTAIQTFRVEADQAIGRSVDALNGLLSDFKQANDAVKVGTASGRDVSDALDRRDAILKKIAEYVPVSTLTRGDNDMVIVTGDGATLFETTPRAVTFSPSTALAAGLDGNKVYVDGVPLKASAADGLSGGIAAQLALRDDATSTMQAQLDEIARGLITAFAEKDPTAANPDRAGLFTWPGGPAIPAAGTLVNGLAGVIALNPAMDTAQGGDATLLRDGGANGAAYVVNTGGSSYSGLLIAYGERIGATMSFDPQAGISPSVSLSAYSSNAIGWFENLRQEASRAAEAKQALAARTGESLSNETGVNIDEEMALLLELEHSYQASARIIKAVDEMLAALLAAA